MAVYDSAKIRHAATMLNQLVSGMSTDVRPGIRAASEYRDSFHGRTAQAMERELEQLLRRANRLEDRMDALAHKLHVYADLLEEADRKVAEKL